MSVYIKNADKLIKENDKQVDAWKQNQSEETNRQADERIAAAEQSAAEQKSQTDEDYIDIINAADLQKELDLKNIRETRANMGLSRSGLSATEQTAAILSAGNKTAHAQRQRQAAIDALNKSLSDYKIEVEDSRRSNLISIEQSAEKEKADYRQQAYKNAYDAETEAIKAQETAKANAEKTRLKVLSALYNNGSGVITTETYAYAIENGLSGAQAQALQANNNKLKEALESGKISKGTYEDAVSNNYTVESAIRKDALSGYASTARKMINESSRGKDGALFYLYDLFSNGYIDEAEFTSIGNMIGIKNSDVENFSYVKATSPQNYTKPTERSYTQDEMKAFSRAVYAKYVKNENGKKVFSEAARQYIAECLVDGKVTLGMVRELCSGLGISREMLRQYEGDPELIDKSKFVGKASEVNYKAMAPGWRDLFDDYTLPTPEDWQEKNQIYWIKYWSKL